MSFVWRFATVLMKTKEQAELLRGIGGIGGRDVYGLFDGIMHNHLTAIVFQIGFIECQQRNRSNRKQQDQPTQYSHENSPEWIDLL